ncbi:MAG TPA: hypothetical protein VHR66_27050 [Gemmataceae bacterium]|jgi:hypothetical protein|nr:hypothetical protein [Gemmataceae bacterium]
MIRINNEPRRAASIDLDHAIEPLASYICAADQPRAALNLVYTALFNEVAQLNREARMQIANFVRTPRT